MSIEKIQKYLEEYSYLKSIQSLLYWDMETMMPSGAIEDRAKRLSYIQGKIHSHITGKKYKGLLDDLKSQKLKPREKRLTKELLYDYHLQEVLPLKHVLELSHATAIASHEWVRARKEKDWKAFAPHLDKLIKLKKKEATFYGTKNPYDALIKLHDKEFDTKSIEILFKDLKKGLLKLKSEVEKDGRFVGVKDLKGPFDIEAQRNLSQEIAEKFGLSREFSRLDVSTHPFSINISPKDQRITTRYVKENLDSLSSTMHEVGHALYEHQLPSEWEGTPFQEAVSLSMHESQSRFWENIIGRSREFSKFIHPIMSERFSRSMKGVSVEELFLYFNKSLPGLIRVESPELYYNLHVIIRFEIEKLIFQEGAKTSDLPKIWDDLYEENLNLRPKNVSEGILQDSHWAGGAFGYFPTYTLGNLITGSLQKKMKKEIKSFSKDVERGEFTKIRDWLKREIHSHGRGITTKEVIGEIQVKDYLDYLTEKFRS